MVEIMQNGLITWSHECNSKKLGCGMGIVNLQGAYTPVGENIIVCIYCQHYYNWVYSPIYADVIVSAVAHRSILVGADPKISTTRRQ